MPSTVTSAKSKTAEELILKQSLGSLVVADVFVLVTVRNSVARLVVVIGCTDQKISAETNFLHCCERL